MYDLLDADGSRIMGSNGSMEATEKIGKLYHVFKTW
jgi:hypothetical protein